MKTIYLLFPVFPLFLLFTLSLQAQLVEDWTEPVALTDSTSNNSNPIVVVLQNNGADVLYMFIINMMNLTGKYGQERFLRACLLNK